MTNKRLFEAKKKEYGDTNATLAKIINLSPGRLSAKMNHYEGAEFTQGEIEACKNHWNLTPVDVDRIFFNL